MSLYEGSVKRPIFTALCFVAVVVFGVFSYTKLPIDQLPDIESNTIMVFTYYNVFSKAVMKVSEVMSSAWCSPAVRFAKKYTLSRNSL